MSGSKTTELTETETISSSDLLYAVTSPGSTPNSRKIQVGNLLALLAGKSVFNVKDFGASGATTGGTPDPTVTTISAASSGTTTVTVASATSFSVGQYVLISNGGPASGEYQGVITSIVGNTVSISPPLQTSVGNGTNFCHADTSVRTAITAGATATSTSVTLTDPSTFAVGQGICIPGAGTSSAWYVGSITALSGSVATVTPALGTTVSNAWAMHDDTIAIRAARDAAATVFVDTVFFPQGIYNVNAALEFSNTARVGFPNVSFSEPKTITLLGEGYPPQYQQDENLSEIPILGDTYHASIIKTSQAGAAIIGGFGTGNLASFSNVLLVLENLVIRTYDNPQCTAVDASNAEQLVVTNCIINTGYNSQFATQPTLNTSAALKTPALNNNGFIDLRNVAVLGHYNGFVTNEHTVGRNLVAVGCIRGFNVQTSANSQCFTRIQSQCCQLPIFNGGTGANIQITHLMVSGGENAPSWQQTVHVVSDSGNTLKGDLIYDILSGGSNTFDGATSLLHRQVENPTDFSSVSEVIGQELLLTDLVGDSVLLSASAPGASANTFQVKNQNTGQFTTVGVFPGNTNTNNGVYFTLYLRSSSGGGERFIMSIQAGGNDTFISERGTLDFNVGTDPGTNILRITSGLAKFSSPVGLNSYAVAGLPSATTPGQLAFVTDATQTAITGLGLAVTGGGSNKVVVYSDGTNWIIL